MLTGPIRPLIAVLGPTASGKSDLAIRLALRFGGEIINCDSLQLYRGFDIGTAKVPEPERQGVPHHLIDILDPDQECNAGQFAALALPVIQEIQQRGRLPILAGGTGFYLRTLLEGLPEAPPRDENLRRCLTGRAEASPEAFHRLLRRLDPVRAAQIHPRDVHKLVRAIEICKLTGGRASDLVVRPPSAAGLKLDVLKLILDPPRQELVTRIAERTNRMFRQGLVEEVKQLLQKGVSSTAKPFESLGYAQTLGYLSGSIDLEQAMERTTIETRQYAKRQMTWFRREQSATFLSGFGQAECVFSTACQLTAAQMSKFT